MQSHLEHLVQAQRALLAPFDLVQIDRWIETACASVRTVAECDHTLFFLPTSSDRPRRPGSGPETVPNRGGLAVLSDDTDPAVLAAYEEAFTGWWGDAPAWDDPLLNAAWETRHRAGGGVFHERSLSTREVVEDSPFYQEALRPYGVRHVIGLAVDGPGGQEYAMVAAYERPDRPAFGDATLQSFRLLYPAFEAFARTHARFQSEPDTRVAALAATVDAFEFPILLIDADGRELHWNRALIDLLGRERTSTQLLDAVHAWARHLAQLRTRRSEHTEPLRSPPRIVMTDQGRYRIYGVPLDAALLGQEGALITLQCVGPPFPQAETLRARFALTPRQTEVVLLLARGRTDREIADALAISHSTARHHAEHALQKLDVRSRAGVAARLWDAVVPLKKGEEAST